MATLAELQAQRVALLKAQADALAALDAQIAAAQPPPAQPPTTPSWVDPGAAVHINYVLGLAWVRGAAASVPTALAEIGKIRAKASGTLVVKTAGGAGTGILLSTDPSTFDLQFTGGKVAARLAGNLDLVSKAITVPTNGKLGVLWTWATGLSEIGVNGGWVAQATQTHMPFAAGAALVVGSSRFGDQKLPGQVQELVGYDDVTSDAAVKTRAVPSGAATTPPPPNPTVFISVNSTAVQLKEDSKDFAVVVTRGGDQSASASVDWVASGDGANPASASDFLGGKFPSGTLTFAPGAASATIHLMVNPDTTAELDEGVKVVLSNPSVGAEISNNTARLVILNDDGTVVVPPPPVIVSPPPSDGSFAPIAGKTLAFSDDFSQGWKQNFQSWFPFGAGDGKDISSRCYFNGTQPCVFTDPDYDPTGPITLALLAGGGVQINTALNPKPTDPRMYMAYVGGVLFTKTYQCKVNSYVEYDMTLSDQRGSFSSGWSWQFPNAEEVDTFEQLGVNPKRLFWGALMPASGTYVNPNPAWAEGAISQMRGTFGTLWTPAGVEWFVNRKSVGFAAIKLTKPRNLICNNTVGGWDENNVQISPNTSVIVHSVRSWQG